MRFDEALSKLGYRGGRLGARAPSYLARALAVVAGAVLLVGAVAISIVVLAVTLTGLLVLGIYLWWRTRELRRQMRARRPDGAVIEGEVIRNVPPEDAKEP